jgi:NAD(P)-dependent dehydrogenase (short-subunit alcohol dehydrogenase family)
MKRFLDKVVIITGAAGDIGRAAAIRFADEGANCVIVDINEASLHELSESIKLAAGHCTSVVADITQADQVKHLADVALVEYSGVDVLFNSAGIEGAFSTIDDYPIDEFDRVMAVNVRGVFLCMKYIVPLMRARGGGSIVNAASVAGLSGAAGFCAYNASKHAVIGITRSVAKQEGPQNIRVNAVCPSAVDGNMMRSLEDKIQPGETEALRANLEALIPLQRYASVADVVSMVTYLCSDEAGFLSGGVYTVDGGMTA